MQNSHNHKHVIILAIALLLLASAPFCWTKTASRAAVENAANGRVLNPGRREPAAATSPATSDSVRAGVRRANDSYGKLPLSFEANLGQTDPRATFVSRGSGSFGS